MIKDITRNDLVLLAYNELSENESLSLLSALEMNPELKREFQNIQNDMKLLDTVSYSPNNTSVQIILEESCSASSMEVI